MVNPLRRCLCPPSIYSYNRKEDDQMIDLKKFKPIPGFSKYLISEYGDIYSLPRKRLLSPSKNWAGYVTVTMVDDNNFRSPLRYID